MPIDPSSILAEIFQCVGGKGLILGEGVGFLSGGV